MTKKLLEAAYRERMGLVGVLQVCTCAFPIERAPTTTQHARDCQAHTWLLRDEPTAAGRGARTEVPVAVPAVFSIWRDGELWAGRCRECGVVFGAATIGALAVMFATEHTHGDKS